MILVLPDELFGQRIEFFHLMHPRLNVPAKYVVSGEKCWEVVRVGRSNSRSAIVPGRVISDASIDVLSPLHPVFLALRTLWVNKNSKLSSDLLRELAVGEAGLIPEQAWAKAVHVVTKSDEAGNIQLDMDKLRMFLTQKIDTITDKLPSQIRLAVARSIAPLNPNEAVPESIEAAAVRCAATRLLASWLPPDIAEWIEAEMDQDETISQMKTHCETLAKLREQQDIQIDQSSGTKKRPLQGKEPAKKAKPMPKGKYISLTQMFKKR